MDELDNCLCATELGISYYDPTLKWSRARVTSDFAPPVFAYINVITSIIRLAL